MEAKVHDPISNSIKRRDHDEKMTGEAIYVGDYPEDASLCGKLLRSKVAKARIVKVNLPKLPEGYFYIDHTDVPGVNVVALGLGDMPVFADKTVEYIGDPIGMFAGPDEKVVDRLLAETVVDVEELEANLDPLTSTEVFYDYNYEKGDVDKAFAEADHIVEERFKTGMQEIAYMETQGMIAEPMLEENRIYLHGSMQCPYYVFNALKQVLNYESDQIRVKQDVTGGGFGGKEDWPSILACQVAVAALKCKQPVRLIYERREDMAYSSKRHPSYSWYKMAVKDGKVTALDFDITYDGGAYSTLSMVVLQRGIICCNGVYYIPNMRVHGKAVKTNAVPFGAYRGFGAPQIFYSSDLMMTHVAKKLGLDPLEFKINNFAKQGDKTSTEGLFHEPVPLPAMADEVDAISEFRRKYKEYSKPQSGRYRMGIGISFDFHGCGFTGSGERDIIKAVMKMHKFPDGRVVALCSNTDIGQGLRTTFPKIMHKELKELGVPLENCLYEYPDTDIVPDSGPTVASRSMMNVGELVRRCAKKLKEIWKDGEDQWVEDRFVQPDFQIPFSISNFKGDAYPTYSWGANVCEVKVDTWSGMTELVGGYGIFDVGTPIDYNIVIGQMEGGFVQGLGHATEIMNYDAKGCIRNDSFADYIVPTAVDVAKLHMDLHVEPYEYGPYGAKGAGELPTVGVQASYAMAMEQALSNTMNHLPITVEDVINALKK